MCAHINTCRSARIAPLPAPNPLPPGDSRVLEFLWSNTENERSMFRLFCQQTTISRGLPSGLTTSLLLLLDLLVCKGGLGEGFGVIGMEESCEQRRRKNTNTLQAIH